jgi:hypothetical protein
MGMKIDGHLLETAIRIAASETWTEKENLAAAEVFAESKGFQAYLIGAATLVQITPLATVSGTFQCGFEAGIQYQKLVEELVAEEKRVAPKWGAEIAARAEAGELLPEHLEPATAPAPAEPAETGPCGYLPGDADDLLPTPESARHASLLKLKSRPATAGEGTTRFNRKIITSDDSMRRHCKRCGNVLAAGFHDCEPDTCNYCGMRN